jgi:gas vesicle protein
MAKTFGKVILATIAGAVAGVLLAPKSGKENRKDLKKKADELQRNAQKKYEQVKKSSKKGKKDLDGIVTRAQGEFEEFKDSTVKHVNSAAKELKKVGLDAKRRSQHISKDAKDTIKKSDS